jgi:hypothetical protein
MNEVLVMKKHHHSDGERGLMLEAALNCRLEDLENLKTPFDPPVE